MKQKIFVEFDGVLNTYTGWHGEDELFEPRDGSADFLRMLSKNFQVFVFTARDREKVYKWLIRHHLDDYICDVINKKEPEHLYIDDRAVRFDGDYGQTIREIENFQPH